jgi:hypothetical protein
MDVTASMNSHLAGLNWWIFNNTDTLRLVSYTFFNDGNNMDDRKKKVGEVGGVYSTVFTGEVAPTVIEAMYAGNGGDPEENDLEAGLIAQNTNPTADAVLLIVDNNRQPRDMKLLRSFNKKVHVMICGKAKKVRLEYLNIAKATGGDLFINGRRIQLRKVQPGGQIKIGDTTYFLTSNGFELH